MYLQVASIYRGIAVKAHRRSYGYRTNNQWSLSPQNLSFLDVPCGLKKSANFWRLLNFVWQTFEFKFDIFPVLFLASFAAIVVNFSRWVFTFEFSRFLTVAGHFNPVLFQLQPPISLHWILGIFFILQFEKSSLMNWIFS